MVSTLKSILISCQKTFQILKKNHYLWAERGLRCLFIAYCRDRSCLHKGYTESMTSLCLYKRRECPHLPLPSHTKLNTHHTVQAQVTYERGQWCPRSAYETVSVVVRQWPPVGCFRIEEGKFYPGSGLKPGFNALRASTLTTKLSRTCRLSYSYSLWHHTDNLCHILPYGHCRVW